MYDLTELVSNVITIRSIHGDEYVGKLMGVDEKNGYITVTEPRIVAINNAGEVSLLPFAITAGTTTVTLKLDNVFAVLPTFEETAEEYLAVVSE